MIVAEVLDSTNNLVYTINIHAELYLAMILGAMVAGVFFLIIKK